MLTPVTLEALCLLLLRYGDRGKESFLGWTGIRRLALEQYFSTDAVDFAQEPLFPGFPNGRQLRIDSCETGLRISSIRFDLGHQRTEQGLKNSNVVITQKAQALPHACLSVPNAGPPVYPADEKRRMRQP